jgi:hypothetical protein
MSSLSMNHRESRQNMNGIHNAIISFIMESRSGPLDEGLQMQLVGTVSSAVMQVLRKGTRPQEVMKQIETELQDPRCSEYIKNRVWCGVANVLAQQLQDAHSLQRHREDVTQIASKTNGEVSGVVPQAGSD